MLQRTNAIFLLGENNQTAAIALFFIESLIKNKKNQLEMFLKLYMYYTFCNSSLPNSNLAFTAPFLVMCIQLDSLKQLRKIIMPLLWAS